MAGCPALCQATEVGHAMHHHSPSKPTPSEPAHPHLPQEGDDGVCGGAIRTNEARATAPDSGDLASPWSRVAPPPAFGPVTSASRATASRRSVGRPDGPTACSLLQKFRC
ncbi:MAG: hypothetical protein BGO49_26275 [Planctomycetales bacterium 71-10]|nr:MAG: hypothetical protein BGO49_26275 [Planctomycetales bacterium 71-10]